MSFNALGNGTNFRACISYERIIIILSGGLITASMVLMIQSKMLYKIEKISE